MYRVPPAVLLMFAPSGPDNIPRPSVPLRRSTWASRCCPAGEGFCQFIDLLAGLIPESMNRASWQ